MVKGERKAGGPKHRTGEGHPGVGAVHWGRSEKGALELKAKSICTFQSVPFTVLDSGNLDWLMIIMWDNLSKSSKF